MYVDDTDLAWRLRLGGMRVRFCPEAVVTHNYEFQKGPHKWFNLERNREWALLSNLQLRTLLLLAPLLLITELAVLKHAFSQRWLIYKLRAWVDLARRLPDLLRWRRSVQATRNVSDFTVLSLFTAGIETDLIDARLPGWVNGCLEAYRAMVLQALRALGG